MIQGVTEEDDSFHLCSDSGWSMSMNFEEIAAPTSLLFF